MTLEWLPRENEKKDHILMGSEHWGTEAPCTVYEKKPLVSPEGKVIDGLYVAWIRLNNPKQYNSYTTEMVKGVIAGFSAASQDRSVVAAVFTGTGDMAFCTGGNTKEYAEYYSRRPSEYGEYMDLFNGMVDAILNCKKPVICRVNGMRVAGGQEIGMACDLAISSDLAIFGQAGARHGSSPDGGSTDFLPWFLSMEDAMWNCVSCEMWSAYKMRAKNLISKVVPVLKQGDKFIRNPLVITDTYVQDGEIVYGEFKTGEAPRKPRADERPAHATSSCWTKKSTRSSGLCQSVPRLPDQGHRRHPREEEILLGSDQAGQPTLADGQHGLRGFPGLQRLQHQEDHRQGRHRFHQVASVPGRSRTGSA